MNPEPPTPVELVDIEIHHHRDVLSRHLGILAAENRTPLTVCLPSAGRKVGPRLADEILELQRRYILCLSPLPTSLAPSSSPKPGT